MAGVKHFAEEWLLPPAVAALLKQAIKFRQRSSLSGQDKKLMAGNLSLQGKHGGTRCFILGAGPSVKEQDLAKLEGEFVISVSNTFVHPEYSRIAPKYHVLPPIMASHGKIMPVENFVSWLKDMEQKTGRAAMFFHAGDYPLIKENNLFEGRQIYWLGYSRGWDGRCDLPIDLNRIPPVGSVSEVAITVALYLGFDQIYLLGFDHDWFNGLFNYFFDHKTEHAAKPDEKELSQVDAEFQMRRHAEMFKKYKYLYSLKKNIFNANANRNSYVDVFPKVNYDELF